MKHVKPSKPGLIVRDHGSNYRPLPPEGKPVKWDTTWARRLRDGDIVIVKAEAEKPAPAPVPKSVLEDKPEASNPRKTEAQKSEVK